MLVFLRLVPFFLPFSFSSPEVPNLLFFEHFCLGCLFQSPFWNANPKGSFFSHFNQCVLMHWLVWTSNPHYSSPPSFALVVNPVPVAYPLVDGVVSPFPPTAFIFFFLVCFGLGRAVFPIRWGFVLFKRIPPPFSPFFMGRL